MGAHRFPALKRASAPPPFVFGRRHLEVLAFAGAYGVVSGLMVAERVFAGIKSPTVRNRHLSQLFHAGLLDRAFLPTPSRFARGPAVYALTKRGAALLAERTGAEPAEVGALDKGHATLFLEHTVLVSQVRFSLETACRDHGRGIEFQRWIGEHEQRNGVLLLEERFPDPSGQGSLLIKPDGACVLLDEPGKRQHFAFVEADRATLPISSRWTERLRAYLAYQTTGRFAARFKLVGSEKFRVLTVTTAPGRLDHLVEAASRLGCGTRFLFALADELSSRSALDQPIWTPAARGTARVSLRTALVGTAAASRDGQGARA